jgi:hypothetical protein
VSVSICNTRHSTNPTPVMYAIFFSVQEQPLVAHPEQQDGEPPRMPRPSMAPKT